MLRVFKDWEGIKGREDYVNVGEMAALEAELADLKEKYNIPVKHSPVFRLLDRLALSKKERLVRRKTYVRLALCCGWFCGAHRFYARQHILGTLYLLFFWTGIPFCMTLIDLMIALPKKEDESGNIII